MASKRQKRRTKAVAADIGAQNAKPAAGGRTRRTDEEKLGIVRQILASANQSAEIKKLGIYPNQFYDWKKRFAAQVGAAAKGVGRRGRAAVMLGGSPLDEARSFVQNRAALLERLRTQRNELDQLIKQLES